MSLYQEIIVLRYFSAKHAKWLVENVKPYYKPLITPTRILGRHCFWSNFEIRPKTFKNEEKGIIYETGNTSRFGFDLKNYKIENKERIIRNLMDPEIALYLFKSAQLSKQAFFNTEY